MSDDDSGRRRIAVDFDETLTEGDDETPFEYGDTSPDEETIEWVNDQYRAGNTIIVWTARPWSAAADTVSQLTKWGVLWHGIRMEKGYAEEYVDDRGTAASTIGDDGDGGDGSEGED